MADGYISQIKTPDNKVYLLKDSEKGYKWNAVTQGQKWSRICLITPTVTTEGSSGILSISCTRGSVVCNATFLITTSHASKCFINALGTTNYSAVRIRGVVQSNGTAYIELYDTANSIASGTTQTWHCSYIPILSSTVTTYTAFTDGTTLPSGYTAVNDFTAPQGNNSAPVVSISRSGTTFTATRSNGSTFTFTQQDNAGITSVTIGATSPVQSSTSTAQTGSSASTTISLKDAYGDTKNPYGTKAKNLVLAGPSSGSNAAPGFRALVAADIPSLAYVPATDGVNDVNTLVNTGVYNIKSGSLTHGPTGYGFGQLLVMSYRKHTGNTTTDWATQIYAHLGSGNNGNTLYYRTSNASTWQTWQMVAHTDAATAMGNAKKPIYINAKGEIQEGDTLKNLAYKDSLNASDIPELSWNKITSDKPTTLSGYGITDANIASGVITLGSNTITPVTSVNGHTGSSVDVTAADLGLSNALHFIGITSTTLENGSTTATLTPKTSSPSSLSKTTGFVDGDVVMDGDQLREYVWSGNAWRLLGITTSTTYTQPKSTATNTWIAQVSQGTDGKITATTGSLITSGPWSGNAATATKFKDDAQNTTKVFYRGDNTWSNILKQTAAAALGIDTNHKIGTAIKDLHFTVGSGSGTGINDGNAGGITIGTDTASYGGIYWQSSGSYGLRLHFATTGSFANGAYTRMLITSDGKVGIGTLTPDTLLTVNGNAKADKFIGALQGNADTATSAGKWTTARTLTIGNTGKSVDGSGNVSWSLAEIGAATGDHTHTISLTQTGTSTINLAANTVYTLTAGGNSVVFKTPADGNTDTKVNVTATGAAISHNYILMTSTAPTTTATGHTALGSTSLWVNSADKGKFELVLGNATATTTAGGQFGQLALYSASTAGTYLKAADGTAWKTQTLQAKDGTIALTSDLPGGVSKTAAGLCPQLPNETTTTKFLRQDGTWQVPAYIADTHYTTHLYVNATAGGATSNAATANTTTYMHLYDNSTKRETIQFKGSGATTVTATGGVITISSTDNNTATATDNILDGSNSGTAITYAPYSAQQNKLSFDTSTTAAPTRTDRLNLNGFLYATKYNVAGQVTLQYNTTDKSLEFIF